MATSVNLGNFYDGFSGATYTCYLIYDAPTRSGDSVTIKNVKARIVSQSGYGTEGRTAVSLTIPLGTSRVYNQTIASSYNYPMDTTVTMLSSLTITNLTTSFTYGIAFSDTGYGSTWNDNYSKGFDGSISCPARTYTISYNANGGTNAPSSQIKTYNVALTLSNISPIRSGYNFLGWSTSSSATSASYQSGGSYTSNGDATLYAVWEVAIDPLQDDIDPEPVIFNGTWLRGPYKISNILKNMIYRIKSMAPLKLAEIDKLLGSPGVNAADYIVEQGVKNIDGISWLYRKWNSGIAECKGTITTSVTSTGDTWSGSYKVVAVNRPRYPFTFIEAPVEIATPVRSSANSYWLYSANSNNTTTQTDAYKAIKLNNFTNGSTLTVAYEVYGRWK